jgi:hypothetical protein
MHLFLSLSPSALDISLLHRDDSQLRGRLNFSRGGFSTQSSYSRPCAGQFHTIQCALAKLLLVLLANFLLAQIIVPVITLHKISVAYRDTVSTDCEAHCFPPHRNNHKLVSHCTGEQERKSVSVTFSRPACIYAVSST